ncbi:MAG: DJ-1/PfpI family protein [Desulfarculus sp.]|nr:DJ-1/PfpI family protein [Desulfarculus sp.]
MSQQPLAGKKIAVLLESEYIPEEIAIYQKRFAGYGATVELMSRLWGNASLTILSDVSEEGKTPEVLKVSTDFDNVDLKDYAAVIMAANYTSVRLRWFTAPEGQAIQASMARDAPAVKFFARAMRDPAIVKGAPCHALWLLTPTPELLAGRRMTCNPVVLADIVNAGAIYVPAPPGTPWDQQVVVDQDLVTNPSYHASEGLVDAIRDAILERKKQCAKAMAAQGEAQSPQAAVTPRRGRRILCILSEWGYWGEELAGPVEEFDKAGYQVDFCTPTGKRPNAIGVSMDPDFIDPPLMRPVTSPEMAEKVRLWDDPSTEQGKRLEKPISLADWFPERPYFASPCFVRGLEAYNRALSRAARYLDIYDAVLLVGGSGPVVDMVNNQRVHDVILSFYRAGKPIGAECYGVACLAFARDIQDRKSIIWGKRVTGHCLEYDYKDGTGFMKARGVGLDFNMGPPPYPLEYILRDATGPDGAYIGNFGHETSVIVDYPFITGRSTPDSILTGAKMIEVLDGDPPLRRWGW